MHRDRLRARTGCASRRRAGAARSRPRRSRRRSRGPGSRPAAAALAPHEQRRRLAPVDLARVRAAALHGEPAVQHERAGERARGRPGSATRTPARVPSGRSSARARAARRAGAPRAPATARASRPRQQLGVLVQQQRVAAARRARAARESFSPLPRRSAERDQLDRPRGAPRAASAEPSREPLSSTSTSVANGSAARSRGDRVQARAAAAPAGRCSTTQKVSSIGSRRPRRASARSPSHCRPRAYCPSRARPRRRPLRLHAALRPRAVRARSRPPGAEVDLYTSRFAYGAVRAAGGLSQHESFYRRAARCTGDRARRAVKLAEHVPDMLRYRARRALGGHRALPVAAPSSSSTACCSRRRARRSCSPPTTSSRASRGPGSARAQRRLYGRFDAVVVHSEHGRARLRDELGRGPRARARDPPRRLRAPRRRAAPAAAAATERPPSVLCFGLMRPYKGIDLLLQAWRGHRGGRAVVAGMPRMDIAAAARPRYRPACASTRASSPTRSWRRCFARADLVVLPYREIDQSGVLFTALAFGKPLLLSDVGGFPEVAATGAARTFPAGDAAALHGALAELLADPRGPARRWARVRARPRRAPTRGGSRRGRRSGCTPRLLASGAES